MHNKTVLIITVIVFVVFSLLLVGCQSIETAIRNQETPTNSSTLQDNKDSQQNLSKNKDNLNKQPMENIPTELNEALSIMIKANNHGEIISTKRLPQSEASLSSVEYEVTVGDGGYIYSVRFTPYSSSGAGVISFMPTEDDLFVVDDFLATRISSMPPYDPTTHSVFSLPPAVEKKAQPILSLLDLDITKMNTMTTFRADIDPNLGWGDPYPGSVLYLKHMNGNSYVLQAQSVLTDSDLFGRSVRIVFDKPQTTILSMELNSVDWINVP